MVEELLETKDDSIMEYLFPVVNAFRYLCLTKAKNAIGVIWKKYFAKKMWRIAVSFVYLKQYVCVTDLAIRTI